MYCDFQPAFLFLLTQGTKRKRSSALANYKTKNILYSRPLKTSLSTVIQ